MVLQYVILSTDNVCDILRINLPIFLAGIFLRCDFFVELKKKKSQQIVLVTCICGYFILGWQRDKDKKYSKYKTQLSAHSTWCIPTLFIFLLFF